MTLRERLERWCAHRRLRRGRCSVCGRVLPDDWTYFDCAECAEFRSTW